MKKLLLALLVMSVPIYAEVDTLKVEPPKVESWSTLVTFLRDNVKPEYNVPEKGVEGEIIVSHTISATGKVDTPSVNGVEWERMFGTANHYPETQPPTIVLIYTTKLQVPDKPEVTLVRRHIVSLDNEGSAQYGLITETYLDKNGAEIDNHSKTITLPDAQALVQDAKLFWSLARTHMLGL